jgi:hypothetical protein
VAIIEFADKMLNIRPLIHHIASADALAPYSYKERHPTPADNLAFNSIGVHLKSYRGKVD